MSEKRKLDGEADPLPSPSLPSPMDDSAALQAYKRARTDTALILSQPPPPTNPHPQSTSSLPPPRTSSLPSPTLTLTGHKGGRAMLSVLT